MRVPSILRPLRRDRPWWGIAGGAALFGLAATVRWMLGGLAEGFGPMLLLPSILLSGLIGGIRVGLGVAAVCFLVAWTWFFPPYGTFTLNFRDAVTVLAFILTAVLELYVIRVLNLAINNLSLAKERSTTMFRELQHRVGNNLAVVAAVLRQERKNLDRDSAAARALERAQERLDLMARVHLSLNNPGVIELPVGSYLKNLGDDLIKASNMQHVHLTVAAVPIALDVERLMSLSMIVAETITNALKYAFLNRSEGKISIDLGVDGRTCTLKICDDGPGFALPSPKTKRDGLGRGIIESLVSQLCGELSLEGGPGATISVVFPIQI